MGSYGGIVCALIPALGKVGCAACGAPLPKGRKRWCSATCSSGWWQAFARNHDWPDARDAALERDGYRCVRCGAGGFRDPEPHLRDYSATGRSRDAINAAFERHYADHRAWASRRSLSQLEVNHIDPRLGRGYGRGCHNHLDNLESLCHGCHVKATNAQRLGRAAST